MPKDVTVESFELDHTIVKAPYVRLISEEAAWYAFSHYG